MSAVLPDDIARQVARGEAEGLLTWLDRDGGDVNARDSKGRTILMLGAPLPPRDRVSHLH